MNSKIFEIGIEFYLIRSDEPDFHRNIYIKRFKSGTKSVNMIMDPGSKVDVEDLSEALKKLIGGIDKIDIIFLSHQDPDVSSSTPFLINASPRAIIVTSQDTIRLVKMYGIPPKKFKAVENLKTSTVQIKETGQRIKFIPAYFCHFRGAMMVYDIESRVLFTGDFMGGINTVDENPVYATESAWEGIAMFHSIYMPSNIALRETIDRIGLLNPFPEILAPQHGYVVKGDLVIEFLNRLSKLDVGMDLLVSREPLLELFLMALNDFGDKLKATNYVLYLKLLDKFRIAGNFTTPFVLQGNSIVNIKIPPSDVIRYLLDVISEEVDHNEFLKIKNLLFRSLEKLELPYALEIIDSGNEDKSKIEIFDE